MLKKENLSRKFIEGTKVVYKHQLPLVEKYTLNGIDEIQFLNVSSRTSIKMHAHTNQWEIWLWPYCREAYICLKGEQHELKNDCDNSMLIMAVKGHSDCSYEDLAYPLHDLGFSVSHGSLIVTD